MAVQPLLVAAGHPVAPSTSPPPSSQFFGDLWGLSILLSLGTTTTGAPSPPCPPPSPCASVPKASPF